MHMRPRTLGIPLAATDRKDKVMRMHGSSGPRLWHKARRTFWILDGATTKRAALLLPLCLWPRTMGPCPAFTTGAVPIMWLQTTENKAGRIGGGVGKRAFAHSRPGKRKVIVKVRRIRPEKKPKLEHGYNWSICPSAEWPIPGLHYS